MERTRIECTLFFREVDCLPTFRRRFQKAKIRKGGNPEWKSDGNRQGSKENSVFTRRLH